MIRWRTVLIRWRTVYPGAWLRMSYYDHEWGGVVAWYVSPWHRWRPTV